MINEIQEQINLIAIAQKYLTLEKLGSSGEYRCCCPFHDESQPSFNINDRVFHCFGCGAKGNAFHFYSRMENVTYSEAVKELTQSIIGIDADTAFEISDTQINSVIREQVVAFYHVQLKQSKSALVYLKQRGIKGHIAKKYRLGYAGKPRGLAKKFQFSEASQSKLKELKLVNRKLNDFMYGKIVVPIFRYDEIVNLYGRAIKPNIEPKHLYTDKHSIPFNWNEGRKYKTLIIVEAIFDALALLSNGYDNVIAYCGTENYKNEYYTKLIRYYSNVERVIILPDKDVGEQGFNSSLLLAHMLLRFGVPTMIAELTDEGSDPSDFFNKHNKDELNKIMDEAKYPIPFMQNHNLNFDKSLVLWNNQGCHIHVDGKIEYQISEIDTRDPRGKKATIALHENSVLLHKDFVPIWSAQRRISFGKVVGIKPAKINSDLLLVDEQLNMFCKELAQYQLEQQVEVEHQDMPEEDREEALLFLRDPRLLRHIHDDIGTMGYVGESTNKVLAYLIGTSRKIKKPMAAIISSQSASGKSEMIKTIAKLMPEEDVKELSRLTRQALYYLPEDALVHKLVLMAEREGSEEADYSIRTMQSEQKLIIDTVEKNIVTGQLETVTKIVNGPMAYIETTTASDINPENMTRCFMLVLDDTEEQTKKIHKIQKYKRTQVDAVVDETKEAIILKHQNAQRLLHSLYITIPYAEHIAFPISQVRTRRDHDRFLDLIEVITFLYQHQREIKQINNIEYIEATLDDYSMSYKLISAILAKTIDEIPFKSRQLLKQIKRMLQGNVKSAKKDQSKLGANVNTSINDIVFTRREVREYTGWTETVTHQYIKPLLRMEYLINISQSGRGVQQKYRWNAYQTEDGESIIQGLTTPEELKQILENKNE